MENQETFQPELENFYTQVTEVQPENTDPDKPCTTCKKGLSKSNAKILIIGVATLFFTFYGVQACIKDILSFFTR